VPLSSQPARAAPDSPPATAPAGSDITSSLDVVLSINATDGHGLDSVCIANGYVAGDACA
jgi:hypothetical protein